MPSYLQLARRSGTGLGALLLYSFLVTDYYRATLPVTNGTTVAAVAVVPSFVVWTVAKQFNKRLVKLIAEEKVAEAYIQIKFSQGSKEFYSEYDEGLQQELDNLDEKFHYQVINILSGAVIAVTAPILALVEFATFGYAGIIAGLVVSVAGGYILGVASYRRMMELLDYSTRISKVTNET